MLLPILINNYLFLQVSENQSVHYNQSNTWSRPQKHKSNSLTRGTCQKSIPCIQPLNPPYTADLVEFFLAPMKNCLTTPRSFPLYASAETLQMQSIVMLREHLSRGPQCDATGYHSPLCEAIGEPTALCSCITVYHQPTEIATKFT